ncbi:unnamed protein product [Calypogeia fissa]
MFAMGRVGRSGFRVFRRSLCQELSGQTPAAANQHSSMRDIMCLNVRNAATLSADGVFPQEDEVGTSTIGTSAPWTIIQRPVLQTLLKSYAQHPTVAQPLILHGPRGVGKRTVIEKLMGKWKKSPHICAYIDLYLNEVGIPPWTLAGRLGGCHEGLEADSSSGRSNFQDYVTMGMIQTQLEQGLESLTKKAVEMGCVSSENVLDALLERHSIDGALRQYMKAHEEVPPKLDVMIAKTTKDKWKLSIQLMKQVENGSFGVDCSTGQLSNSSSSRQKGQSGPGHRKPLSTSKAQSTEEAFMSLALAKKILKIQEDWRVSAGSNLTSSGIVTRTSADASTSWAVLLLRLLSFAAQEGHFQPKLVINNVELLRKAAAKAPGGNVHGALYHDSLLMHITKMGVNVGCIPIILVSSDSYYSCKVFADHGDDLAFTSHEVLGWTPKEAEIHLVPAVFEESEWKLITGILGSTARHLAEVHSIWNNPSFLTVLHETTENAMGDCIDLYLGYLQVTAVDPAMESAIEILQKFAEDCIAGKIRKNYLKHGVAWRHPPSDRDKHRGWAKIQLLDYIQALADTGFAVNHRDVRAKELLEDPSTNALLEVGLLYQQKDVPYLRPITRGVSRCLVRWCVRERLNWSLGDKLKYTWHRFIRGRFYKQLMIV